ncbi:MAG: DNA polymerase III subunit delta, partial [Candidatus Acidiferrum sp.]
MVRYAPAASRSKVVILDEAHMLTGEASNALLKTLEEPPDRVIFVMATTQPEDLVDTIRSRSQHFHFRALTFGEITERLQEIAQKENLKIDAGALAVIARMAEGSMRDALSLLEQARAYCGETIGNDAVRELLGVVPDDALAELVAAIAEGSADRALGLIHTFQKEGRNLQHFCREAIRHMRNLLIAKVCGADSDLIAATADQRPALAEAAALFSEEDLTRFFQILLQTDDDLRRKPDARVHLEMGLLRLINAARLAPLEELLTEIKTGTGGGSTSGASGGNFSSSVSSAAAGTAASAAPFGRAAISAQSYGSANAATVAPAVTPSVAPLRASETESPNEEGEGGSMCASYVAPIIEKTISAAAVAAEIPLAPPLSPTAASATNGSAHSNGRAEGHGEGQLRLEGITAEQVAEIKSTVERQQKFLSGLLEHAGAWELTGVELKLYYAADKKWCAEMLEGRDSLEKLRSVSSKVLGRPIRVCAKLEAGSITAATSRAGSDLLELRARFEGDPLVRSLLQRFGGKISEVRRAQEE